MIYKQNVYQRLHYVSHRIVQKKGELKQQMCPKAVRTI